GSPRASASAGRVPGRTAGPSATNPRRGCPRLPARTGESPRRRSTLDRAGGGRTLPSPAPPRRSPAGPAHARAGLRRPSLRRGPPTGMARRRPRRRGSPRQGESPGAAAGKVGAVLVGGRRPDAATELDPVARYHRGVRGQGCRDDDRRHGLQPDDRRPSARSRRADALNDGDPWPIATRDRARVRNLWRRESATEADGRDAQGDRRELACRAWPAEGKRRQGGNEPTTGEEHDGERRGRAEP